MHPTSTVLATLLLTSTMAACADDPSLSPIETELETSRATWEEARDASDDSYAYSRYRDLGDGVREKTSINISDGEVLSRDFILAGPEIDETIWTETGSAQIGTHDEGFPAVTLDELYAQCADEILTQSEGTVDITFSTFSDGILQRCVYVDTSLEEAEPVGVQLDSIAYISSECFSFTGGRPCG